MVNRINYMEMNEDKKDFKTNTVGDIFSDNPKIL